MRLSPELASDGCAAPDGCEDEVARVATFLASKAPAGVTGQTIKVGAGIAMN